MKPCLVRRLGTITRGPDKGAERVVIHFTDINANTEIIFDSEKNKELFHQLCDYMKSGKVFDFNLLKMDANCVESEQ